MSGAALIALALTSFAWRGQTGFAGFAREVRAGLPEGDRASGVKPILFAREGRAWRPRVSFCTGGQSVEVEKNRMGRQDDGPYWNVAPKSVHVLFFLVVRDDKACIVNRLIRWLVSGLISPTGANFIVREKYC